MTEPSAKVIADSISPDGHRLTTIEVTCHRIVLAELNTHRVFSRNSASSRAIPVAKQIARVTADPAWPVYWGANEKGMQANEELPEADIASARHIWLKARDACLVAAEDLRALGLHKQLANRLLEPWMWVTDIVSSTEWANFWKQRCTKFSPLAQPEMRAAADAMYDVYEASAPQFKGWGDWHLPYTTKDDCVWAVGESMPAKLRGDEALKRISVARCARVSYLTHDGLRDPNEDLAMYDRLVSASPMHASPLEHVARPIRRSNCEHWEHQGNFWGWTQLRHAVERDRVLAS